MKRLFGRFAHVHLVGIGGVGMEGLARWLRARGLRVTGSDRVASPALDLLRDDGFEVFVGHRPEHVGGADLLVYSAAVPADNPERLAARRRGVMAVSRGELLGELSRHMQTLAVAGAHGKTTSASMLAAVLERAGRAPDVLVGGWIAGRAQGGAGDGEWLVVEADEFARSFLHLHPDWALVTCIDADHLDCYGSLEEMERAFAQFLARLPFYGVAVVGGDGLVGEGVLAGRRCLRFGLDERCDYAMGDVQLRPWGSRFSLCRDGRHLGEIELPMPGLHNARNAAGAAALALESGVEFGAIRAALAEFGGVDRRFQRRGEVGGVCVVDDYAHHPTELAVALAAARACGRRVVAVFQPHLYSRTRDFAEGFARELAAADFVVLTDVYAAREEPLPGVDVHLIERALRARGACPVEYAPRREGLARRVAQVCREGDLVLMMGAGDIGEEAGQLLEVLASGGSP